MPVFGTNIGIYVRRSMDRDGVQTNTIKTQVAMLEDYCASKVLTIAGYYIDDGVSGSMPFDKRREGSRLLSDIADGLIDGVAITALDRAFRKTSDACEMIDTWIKDDIHLHILDLGGNRVTADNPMGKMILTIMASLAEFERNQLVKRIKDVLDAKKARNEKHCYQPVYGYQFVKKMVKGKNVGEKVGHWKEQENIKVICAAFKGGAKVGAICKLLYETEVENRAGSIVWAPAAIYNILERAGLYEAKRKGS